MWTSHRVPIGRKRSRTRGWSRCHGREGRIRRDQPQLRLPKSQSGCIHSFSSLPPLLEGKFWSKFDARSRPRRSDLVWGPSPDYSPRHCEVPSGRWSYLNLLQTTRFLEHDTYPELCHFIETTQQQGINHYILHCLISTSSQLVILYYFKMFFTLTLFFRRQLHIITIHMF